MHAQADLVIDTELLDRVKTFVAGFVLMDESELCLDTRLGHDLGVDGDDARELIDGFCEEFGLADAGDIDLSPYFFPEGHGSSLRTLWAILFDRKQLERVPITLRDLIVSVQEGRWVAPSGDPEE